MIIHKSENGIRKLLEYNSPEGGNRLEHQNWVEAGDVSVKFHMLHDGSSVCLKYFVTENHVRAVNSGFNTAVWEDSCVEFFFSPEGDENYYNFEFNAIGAVLGAYGKDRHSRSWLPESVLEQIETYPSLGKEPFREVLPGNAAPGETTGPVAWDLSVRIPVEVLAFSNLATFSGLEGSANFYKCGDLLPQPHFLSWQPVLNDTPDFHLPQFFGKISFQ
jgi:hypothetical protein